MHRMYTYGETATLKDSNAPSDGSSIGAHVSEVEENDACPTRSVKKLLATHAVDDLIWDHTGACDVSLDTKNSAEALAGIHITGGSTYNFRRSYPHKLIYSDDVTWYDGSDFLNNYNEWDKSPNTNVVKGVNNDSTKEFIKSDFRTSKRQS